MQLGGIKLNSVLLTQYDGAILGPIAKVLGWLLSGIFYCIDAIGLPNVALAIFLFTIIIYMIMLPLTIKQQKFSKLSAKMSPELQAVQAKYKGKKDQDSMTRMNEETQAIYKKYGVSPTGSCVYLIIQMPILFALYRVIYNIPAYVGQVKQAFIPFVEAFMNKPGADQFIQNADNFAAAPQFAKQFTETITPETFIDVLNRASTAEWANLSSNFPDLSGLITDTTEKLTHYYNLFGLNIANSPSYYVSNFKANIGLAIGALLIPVLAALTQWLNTKLMPQQDTTGNDQANAVAASMKSMNIVMPLMSMVFCYTLPIGLGLYWIAGAVVRGAQQVFVNKHIDKMDLDAIVAKNNEKIKAEMEKKGVKGDVLNNNARLSTKTMATGKRSSMTDEQREEAIKKSTEYYNKGFKPGSLAAKANMVKQYNEKNNKN